MLGFRSIVASNCLRFRKSTFHRVLIGSHVHTWNLTIKRLFPASYCLSQFKYYAVSTGGPRKHENQPHFKTQFSQPDVDNYFNKTINEYQSKDVKEMVKTAGKKRNNINIEHHSPKITAYLIEHGNKYSANDVSVFLYGLANTNYSDEVGKYLSQVTNMLRTKSGTFSGTSIANSLYGLKQLSSE